MKLPFLFLCFSFLFITCKEEEAPPLSSPIDTPSTESSILGTYQVSRLYYKWDLATGHTDSVITTGHLLEVDSTNGTGIKIGLTRLVQTSASDEVIKYTEEDPSSLSIRATATIFLPDSIFFERKEGGLGSQLIYQYWGSR